MKMTTRVIIKICKVLTFLYNPKSKRTKYKARRLPFLFTKLRI